MQSFVARTLEKYYKKIYRDLSEAEKKAKITAALKKTIPKKVKSTGSLATMVYEPAGDDKIDDVIDIIDSSGFLLVYDSFSEGLEPVYFWFLDFMRDNYWGPGLEVSKTMDEFESSVGGGFFGDIGTRASIMQDRATKLIGTINTVVRSIINILYDLKEFDQRLDSYDKLESENKEEKNAARLGLKQIWMDRVDIQRGRGSINMLTQQLQFVTLRDAFMAANSIKDIENMDLNDRVKRILSPRIEEYLTWEKISGDELKRRYNIEKTYLKSQVDALKLYTQWAKPYLQAAQQLKLNTGTSADIVNVFNNLKIQVNLFGKRQISPPKSQEWPREKKFSTKPSKKYYACVELGFSFRSIPHTMRQTQSGTHYVQGGRVEVTFRAFGLDEDEVKAVEQEEMFENLDQYVEGITQDTLNQIQEDLKHYLEDEEPPENPREKIKFYERLMRESTEKNIKKQLKKKIEQIEKQIIKEKQPPGPFSSLMSGFKEISKFIFKSRTKSEAFVAQETRVAAAAGAASDLYRLYHVYKKTHGMLNE